MILKKLAVSGGLAAALALAAPVASSASTVALQLDDGLGGAATLTIVDGDALDANSAPGAVTYVGAYGTWILNVSTAVGSAILGLGNIDLSSVNVGLGTLTVAMTEYGLTDVGVANFWGGIGGTTDGSVNWSMWVDAEGADFGRGTEIGSGSSSTTPFSASLGSAADTGGTSGVYSWSLFVDITHAGRQDGTSFDFDGNIPTPGSLALLGIGLAGAGFMRRRRAA